MVFDGRNGIFCVRVYHPVLVSQVDQKFEREDVQIGHGGKIFRSEMVTNKKTLNRASPVIRAFPGGCKKEKESMSK